MSGFCSRLAFSRSILFLQLLAFSLSLRISHFEVSQDLIIHTILTDLSSDMMLLVWNIIIIATANIIIAIHRII